MKNADNNIEGVYDVACGQCIYSMTGDECELAIQIDGKAYYVEGSGIDDHGDAHAHDGLCSTSRKANVKGELKKGAFFAEKIELITE